ncbi:MAG TPA: RRXRR domain-containing protein [Ktedonobacteraceae bacterium]|nr:RRXRR domain-containing protein [Ktedonobacteraceae bacterium]
MRVPVIDTTGRALMPCTPAKARQLFKQAKARIVAQLKKVLPLTDAVVEDVQAVTRGCWPPRSVEQSTPAVPGSGT